MFFSIQMHYYYNKTLKYCCQHYTASPLEGFSGISRFDFGTIGKLYKCSFINKKKMLGILEFPVVYCLKTIQSGSQFSYLREFKAFKTWDDKNKPPVGE